MDYNRLITQPVISDNATGYHHHRHHQRHRHHHGLWARDACTVGSTRCIYRCSVLGVEVVTMSALPRFQVGPRVPHDQPHPQQAREGRQQVSGPRAWDAICY